MTTYVEIGGNQYPAVITGRLSDKDWDNRNSKSIMLEMTYAEAVDLFVNDVAWNILQDVEVVLDVRNEDGTVSQETSIDQERYDNSDYCIAGSITDNRDGTITVKMGKPTAEELLAILESVVPESNQGAINEALAILNGEVEA